MVTCLSVLTRLELLYIIFESSQSCPDLKTRRPPPLTRTPVPVLTELRFTGVLEYLEDLVARINAPQLGVAIFFLHQLIFDAPQLMQFISRTPKFKALDEAGVIFSAEWGVSVTLPHTYDGALRSGVSDTQSGWQLSSLAQLCSSSFPQALIHAVQHLYILVERYTKLDWQDDLESSQWPELLHPFTAVKDLFISQEITPRIPPILQELVVGERVSETLPALENFFLEGTVPPGPVQEGIDQFATARQLSSHPVAFSR